MRTYAEIGKRAKETIRRTLERLEIKYGDRTVHLVATHHFKAKSDKNYAIKKKQELEEEIKNISKKYSV